MHYQAEGSASVRIEKIMLPTYGVGKADKNPMFLEKRVYQGSSGKVYPYPVIDKILDEKVDKEYTAVWLENDYIRVMVLPELGGRIQRAYDKTNGYDFVYYNEVIKPALVGLLGPWISGGIEFNWPQHHRPTTYSPTDYQIIEHSDGSKSVECSEVDQMYGTKGKMRFTVYPDKAYIEIKAQLYNRTNMPQTFLWWANPAVPVNDYTQSIFPPDVHAVFDHGKRDVSNFPIATGVYYKHDYGAGVDISRYKNIPVPTSYMCAHSDFNFMGGYDYQIGAGLLHVADHHVSPGKKQWTWGNGDFGQAWDRSLTDENGPYIELMTGMYCDNQPDFTWLKPFEEKVFTQYFMPYKAAANVKNASTEVVLNLEKNGKQAEIAVYATGKQKDARITLTASGQIVFDRIMDLSPVETLTDTVLLAEDCDETALTLTVYNQKGRKLLDYTPIPKKIEQIPDPAAPAKLPEEYATNEDLYLTGQHIEQYRHATYLPDPYYLEGLKRDPGDIRINTAYGLLLLRRGLFAQSETYFRAAIERMTLRNPNPYDSEAYYNLGLSLLYQGKTDDAYDAFYKSTWTAAQQEMGYYYLAAIDARRGEYDLALEHIDRSLVKNYHNLKARALRGMILVSLHRTEEAKIWLAENLKLDAFDYTSRFALASLGEEELSRTLELMDGRYTSFIESAMDCAEAGYYERAVRILNLCPVAQPMVYYHKARYASFFDGQLAQSALQTAAAADSLYCFPNKLEDILALEYAIEQNPSDGRAHYYLGCLCYDRRQYDAARSHWETSAALEPEFPTVWRNLSLAYYNKYNDPAKALECMERAYALDESDARILLELDQLYKKLNRTPAERYAFLDAHRDVAFTRDDLYIEYCTLLNTLGRHQEAYDTIMAHKFHVWEGGEGKVTKQYATALTQLARKALEVGNATQAKELLLQALVFPHNLGEGKLEGQKDNDIYFYLGLAEQALGNDEAGKAYLERAAEGDEEPASMMYYNDQPADMILYQGLANRALGRQEHANSRFFKLISYGEKHYYDEVKIDYFAVSLPDLQLFEDDLTARNRAHCEFLIAMGSFGMGDLSRATKCYDAALDIDCSNQNVVLYRSMIP